MHWAIISYLVLMLSLLLFELLTPEFNREILDPLPKRNNQGVYEE